MVASAKWRTVFRFANQVHDHLEHVGYIASFAAGLSESAPRIQQIVSSPESAFVKGLQLSSLAGTIAQRSLVGSVPAGVHLIYKSLEGWLMIAGLAGGKTQSVAAQGIETLHRADALVQSTYRTITDTSNQSKAFWWVVDLAVHPRKS